MKRKNIILRFIGLMLFVVFPITPLLSYANDTLHFTVDEAIEYALKNNETVLAAKAKLAERRAGIGTARASFLPTLDVQGTYTRLGKIQSFEMAIPKYMQLPLMVYDIQTGLPIGYTDSISMAVGADTMELEMGQQDNYLLRTTIKQPLFTGGKILNGYRIARLSYDVEKNNNQKTINDTRYQVIQLFYQTLAAQEGVGLINESYNQMARHVNQVEQLYNNGFVSKLDLLRAKVGFSNLHTQLIRAENGYKLAKDGMKMLLAIDPEKEIIFESKLSYEPYDVNLDRAVEAALQNRPEIKSLKKTVDIAKRALNIEMANFSPNVFVALNYDYKKPVTFSNNEWGTDWNITVGFTMPIFSGFSRITKIDERRAQINQTRYGLAQLEEGIKLDVKSAFLNLKQEEEILNYQDENVKQAEEALRLAEERYKNGLITNLEYMDMQLSLLQAKTEYVSALSKYLIARAKLQHAMGE